jgi:hypothetical protein
MSPKYLLERVLWRVRQTGPQVGPGTRYDPERRGGLPAARLAEPRSSYAGRGDNEFVPWQIGATF